jgi:phage replication initiation protein
MNYHHTPEESGEGGPLGPLPGSSPRPVTRGESTPNKVKVDWLNCTFPKPQMSASGFVSHLGRMLGRPVSAVDDRGMLGFENSVKLFAHHGSAVSPIGCLAFGGESQRGRWLFQLTGAGCQFVKDWDGLADFIESLDAKLTRVDLALDFLHGEHSVEEAVTLYGLGGFNSGGRAPSSRIDGDWLGEVNGRTLYVGRATNGKMLRVYEKGRQLGDADSAWTRFEVQLGSRDRVLPFDCLTNCDAFFAGCYPALASMIDDAALAIPTNHENGEVTMVHLLYHFKRCYGKLVDTVLGPLAADNAQFIEHVRIIGTPKRLNLSSLAAGLTWEQVHSRSEGRS